MSGPSHEASFFACSRITSEQTADRGVKTRQPSFRSFPPAPPAAAAPPPGTEHCRLFSPHRSYAARRPKPPGQFRPTHTGAEHRWRPPQCHRHESRGRCSYDVRRGGTANPPYQAPLSTPAAAAPTHTSTGAFGGRHWVANWALCSRGRVGRWVQRRRRHSTSKKAPCGNGRSLACTHSGPASKRSLLAWRNEGRMRWRIGISSKTARRQSGCAQMFHIPCDSAGGLRCGGRERRQVLYTSSLVG
jgi:hypothetical protein